MFYILQLLLGLVGVANLYYDITCCLLLSLIKIQVQSWISKIDFAFEVKLKVVQIIRAIVAFQKIVNELYNEAIGRYTNVP